jgi:beta-phosphoglucomutase-like phosphatase (HAD superfamily)
MINGLDFLAFVFIPAELERVCKAADVADSLRAIDPLNPNNYGREYAVDALRRARDAASDWSVRTRIDGVVELIEKLQERTLKAEDVIGYAASSGYPKLVTIVLEVMRGELTESCLSCEARRLRQHRYHERVLAHLD